MSNKTQKNHPYPWIPADISIKLQRSLCAIWHRKGKLTACLMVNLRFRLGRGTEKTHSGVVCYNGIVKVSLLNV